VHSPLAVLLTRSPFAATITCLSAFTTLIGVANEPTHPQSLCALLIAGIVFAGPLVGTSGRVSATLAAGAVGAGAALLLLTKANLGVYLLLTLGLAVASSAGRGSFARIGFLVAGVAGLLLPITLMRPLLSRGWAARLGIRVLRDRAVLCCQFVRLGPILTAAVLACAVSEESRDASERGALYRTLRPLALPGASLVRLDLAEAEDLRAVCVELKRNSDVFFSLPGWNSLRVWTETDPPSSANAGF